jgi:hypothetical protein
MRAGAFCLCAGALGSSLACEGKYVPPTAPTVQPPPTTTRVPAPTPKPSAYSVAGVVREVNGAPLTGVTVETNPPGLSTRTNGTGAFSLEDVTQSVLVFWKDGFRFTYWSKPTDFASNAAGPLSIKMQPLFTLSVASGVSSVITEDDLTYLSENEDSFWAGTYFCAPCKEIQVRPVHTGARLRLRWTGPTPLDVWAGEYYAGVSAHGAGASGESEVVLEVPGRLDTVLVGVGPRNGAPQTLVATESFDLTIEP